MELLGGRVAFAIVRTSDLGNSSGQREQAATGNEGDGGEEDTGVGEEDASVCEEGILGEICSSSTNLGFSKVPSISSTST